MGLRKNRTRKVVLIAAIALCSCWVTPSQGADSIALYGTVTSRNEPQMEGVLVSAKKVGGTITVTVATDSRGHYQFPSSRLQPGKYRLRIRAVGYELDDPGEIELLAHKSKELNLTLRIAHDLAAQLTNAEWMLSIPGTDEQKRKLMSCVGCHTLYQPIRSRYDAKAFIGVLDRMNDYVETSIFVPGEVKIAIKFPKHADAVPDPTFAQYLSTINVSSSKDGKWNYELKTLGRPKGKGTKAVVTEYDLPRRECQPHDAAVDSDGMVWYTDFGLLYLGRLDPRTGEVKEWKVPALKPGSPGGGLDIQFDRGGNPWIILKHGGGIAKFDRKAEKFLTWSIPPELNDDKVRLGMIAVSRDGSAWFKDNGNRRMFKLNPESGKISHYPSGDFYGMDTDSHGNLYLASLRGGLIGEMDGTTGKLKTYPTPTPRSGARRGHMDPQDRFWFAEFYAGKIGMFDTKTKQFQEWSIPTPWAAPYDAVRDKNGEVWAGGMHTDQVYRLDPQSGQVTTYLLPTSTNIRRVDVQNSTAAVAFWVGSNHGAKLVRLEPLD